MFDFATISIDKEKPAFVKSITHKWALADYLGAVRVRSAIGRYSYSIQPGLYALGKPGSGSDVFVTANYKLSFDILRRDLAGTDAWILVLDTKGINVWCAAGKGTFGTAELINRIRLSHLQSFVSHKKIIVPQLGAVGVAAHEVTRQTGFRVLYGPVRSSDIRAFVANKYTAGANMRNVKFTFTDRLILAPVEISMGFKYLVAAVALFALISGLSRTGFSWRGMYDQGIGSAMLLAMAFVSGTLFAPALLPVLPGRAFAVKGAVMGLATMGSLFYFNIIPLMVLPVAAWTLLFVSISSFLAMNFTGASTYTSMSGVKKEMKYALPLQIAGSSAGFAAFTLSKFLNI